MNNWYLAAGDFGFLWPGQIRSLSWLPQVYQTGMGFGWSQINIMWLAYPYTIVLKLLDFIGLSWWGIEKLLWLSVFIIGIYSSYRLANYILKSRLYSFMASFIYIANTYFLLLFGGRQMGVALAYSLSPLVLLKFIQFIDASYDLRFKIYDLRIIVMNGLLLALLICFDLRLAYLILGAVMLYGLFCSLVKRRFIIFLSVICYLLFVICISAAVHLFWILPLVMVRTGSVLVGEDFTNVGMLRFLSVADFSHALALLAPNWPENLFGKVYFLQPEFLALPLFAFSALALKEQITDNREQIGNKEQITDNREQMFIRYFAILALLGAFLAKGANPPFGGMYVWLFEHVPGFIMFRDPTKFYLYIALGYSVLIPYTLKKIIENPSASSGLRTGIAENREQIVNSREQNREQITENR